MIIENKKNELTRFIEIGDSRGKLVSLEALKNVPFEIKRVYYVYEVPTGVSRGFHAHKDLQQLLVCISGSCEVVMHDGFKKRVYLLNEYNKGLYIDKMVWHEIHNHSQDCVIMVLASDYYNEADYIRNYNEFMRKKRSPSE